MAKIGAKLRLSLFATLALQAGSAQATNSMHDIAHHPGRHKSAETPIERHKKYEMNGTVIEFQAFDKLPDDLAAILGDAAQSKLTEADLDAAVDATKRRAYAVSRGYLDGETTRDTLEYFREMSLTTSGLTVTHAPTYLATVPNGTAYLIRPAHEGEPARIFQIFAETPTGHSDLIEDGRNFHYPDGRTNRFVTDDKQNDPAREFWKRLRSEAEATRALEPTL